MSSTQTGTLEYKDFKLKYAVQWMPRCCGVGLLTGFSIVDRNDWAIYAPYQLLPETVAKLAADLNNLFEPYKKQWEQSKATGREHATVGPWDSDFPGIVYANLTSSQIKMLGPIFDAAGWSKVKLNDQGHTEIENTVHGPHYITTYFKVFCGKTR
mgnify:CR=1 FL=1